jgi:hypothetical protein
MRIALLLLALLPGLASVQAGFFKCDSGAC